MANKNLLKANPLAMAAKTAGAAKKKLEEEERKKRAQQTAKAAKSPVSMAVKATADTAKKAAKATKQTSEKAKQEKSKVKAATRTNYLARTGGALSKNQDKTSGFVQQRNPLTLAQANAATGLTSRDLVNTAKAGGIEPDGKKARQDNARVKREVEAKRKADAAAPLSKYDKKLPAGSQDTIREASREWQKANAAGDEAGKAAAHAKAERARSFAGYSGGSTGWDYISPELSKEDQRKLTPQGQKALKKAKLDWEAANAAGDEAGKEAAAKRGQEVRAAKGYRAGGTPGLEYTDAHGRTLDVMTPAEREKWKEQTAAAWKATGTGLVGSVLSAAETAGQATRNRIQEQRQESDLELANNLDNIRARLRRAQAGESGEDVATLQRLYDRALSAQERINRRWANPRSDIVDPNLPGQRLMEKSQEYTAQALQGKSGLEKLLTQAGISIGQNLPSMGLAFVPGVGPALGAGLMGAQAAGSKSYELNQRGISPGESLARGLVSGGIEAATEYLPIKSLLNIVKGKGGQSVLKSLASQAGIEATEEGAAYVGNYLADKAAQDPEANFDLRDLAENAAVGAISGAVFGGAGGAVNAVARARANARQNNPLLRTIDRLNGSETAQEAAIAPEAYTPAQVQEQSAEEALQARERDYTQRAEDWTRRATQARTEQERAEIMEEFDALLQEEQAIARERTRLRQTRREEAPALSAPEVQQEQPAQAMQQAAAQPDRQMEPTQATAQASQPESQVEATDARREWEQNTAQASENAPYSVGAAPAGFDPYTRAANEYGTIEPGENPARIVDVPRSMTGEDRVRRFARTAMEAEITSPETREQIAQGIVENGFSYRPNKDRDSLDRAYKTIEEKGVEGALNQWQDVVDGNRRANKDDMVLAQALYVNAERTGDSSLAAQLAAQIAAEGTISGQNVQALRLLKQATPEGRVYYMRKIVGKLNEDLAKKKRVDKLTDNESIQLDDVLLQTYLEAEDSQAQTDALNAIYDDVARQMDPTAGDVLNAWRYFAMLGNPRTHIRNVLGNVIFGTVRNASNELSSVLQRGLIRDSAQRTRAVVSTPAARAFAQADYQEMKDALAGNKYNSDLDEIRRRVQNNALGPLSFLSKANSWALSAEDNLFKRLEYTRSLASYITAHGWDPANMTHSQLQAARTHAMNDALEATFQEANQVASAIARFEQTNALTRVAVGGAFPFKGVPINIAKEGFRYSPAGLMKAITADAAKVKRGEMTAADMIDNLSSGLTGTGIAMLGYWLSSLGMVTAGSGEDEKENLLDAADGDQNYSLNIGNWSYTIDWAAPAALPFFIGAEFQKFREESAEEEWEELSGDQKFKQGLSALGRMFEPMSAMTMLSGVSSTLKTAAYTENFLTGAGSNLLQSFGGQFIPTALGQVARYMDPVRRSNYVDKDSGIPTSIQRFIQTQQNKIPGLSKRNLPYLNVWGEEQKNTYNENPLLRALEIFASPGYVSRRTTDNPLTTELKRLNSLGYEGVLPSMRQKGQSVDLEGSGEPKRLTRDQWEQWQRYQGTTAKSLLDNLVGSESYGGMSDDEKAAAVKRIFDFSKSSGKLEIGGKANEQEGWVEKARDFADTLGNGSPLRYFEVQNKRSEIDENDYNNTVKQGLMNEYINSSNDSPEVKNYLLDTFKFYNMNPAKPDGYNKAVAQGYTDPAEISKILDDKKNADVDDNDSYKIKEIADFIKSQTSDPTEQNRLWEVYKQSNWKKTWSQAKNFQGKGSGEKKKGKKKSGSKKAAPSIPANVGASN